MPMCRTWPSECILRAAELSVFPETQRAIGERDIISLLMSTIEKGASILLSAFVFAEKTKSFPASLSELLEKQKSTRSSELVFLSKVEKALDSLTTLGT
jgi:hypothetical protein